MNNKILPRIKREGYCCLWAWLEANRSKLTSVLVKELEGVCTVRALQYQRAAHRRDFPARGRPIPGLVPHPAGKRVPGRDLGHDFGAGPELDRLLEGLAKHQRLVLHALGIPPGAGLRLPEPLERGASRPHQDIRAPLVSGDGRPAGRGILDRRSREDGLRAARRRRLPPGGARARPEGLGRLQHRFARECAGRPVRDRDQRGTFLVGDEHLGPRRPAQHGRDVRPTGSERAGRRSNGIRGDRRLLYDP